MNILKIKAKSLDEAILVASIALKDRESRMHLKLLYVVIDSKEFEQQLILEYVFTYDNT